jgi:hypothetical protein
MADCCVKGCAEVSAVRQPLVFGDKLAMHVPLCRAHSEVWEAFVAHLNSQIKRRAKDAKLAGWAFDAALALATFPPHDK